MRELLRVYRREAGAYFVSPVAYLFIGVFLAVTLFTFFWGEAFFARNIADVRPLFEWMPLLLIALVAVLTMRSWSEERRSDTLELLLTAPVSPLTLIGGKFLAALSLVALALALTLPLPLTVDFLGPLDWGPVIGGYVASLFLAAAYIAIGLFVSSCTDNQIVSLLVMALIGGGLYIVGTDWVTALAPASLAELLRLIGTGSRFEEITRGVLDLRDLYYYVSVVAVFLALNVYSLEKYRWGGDDAGARRHGAWRVAVGLVAVNFVAANLWLQPIAAARADMTAGNRYSLSEATHTYLDSLREPLLIRGYFSRETHPLLKPLVPQMRDLLREYGVVGGDDVHVEFVDPEGNPEAVRSAKSQYGIEPVALQTASRYKSSVVNAYFHVVVKYGNEHVTLDYRDLIEIKRGVGTGISVALRNPEYELTRSIRKVARKYRSGGDILASLQQPVTVHAYVSPASRLPDKLAQLRTDLEEMLRQMQARAPETLTVEFQPPGSVEGQLAKRLEREYGFRPMTTSLLSDRRFYFYLVLEQGGQTVPVQPPDNLKKADLRAAIDAGLQQLAGGYLKTVAVYQPSGSSPRTRMLGGQSASYRDLMAVLKENAAVTRTDLKDGRVPTAADMLMVLDPDNLTDKQRFAIDQFLMRGGTVLLAASPMDVTVGRRSGVHAQKTDTGLANWLASYGVDIRPAFVLDPQSGTLTLPTRGPAGGIRMQSLDYPYFIDVREPGLADVPVLGELRQVTMAWTSPLEIDEAKAGKLTVTRLVHSSPRAWVSTETEVLPDYEQYPALGFKPPEKRGRHTLAVMLEGRFTSAFKGESAPSGTTQSQGADSGKDSKPAKLKVQMKSKSQAEHGADSADDGTEANNTGKSSARIKTVIEHSPDNARLIVFGSSSFVADSALQIVGRSAGTQYAAPAKLVQNVADYSMGDPALLAIRGGGQYTRLLRPISDGTRVTLESLNYAAALGGLGLVFFIQRGVANRRRRWFERILNKENG